MSVARVLELSAVSPDSFEAAIREAVDRATRTLRGVQSAWVKDMNVLLENDAISGFQVNLAFTFVLEEGESIAEFEGTTGTASEIPEFEGTRGTASDEDIRRGTPAGSVTSGGTVRGGTAGSPGTTTPRDAAPDPPRGQEGDTTTAQSDVPMGTTTSDTAPGTTTGTTTSRDAPPDAPSRQEERPVRQSEKRREEDRGREEDKGLIDRAVDSLTRREDESEPRRGEEGQDRPRR
jgi:hypothetical protein